jgi:hypothetical protein
VDLLKDYLVNNSVVQLVPLDFSINAVPPAEVGDAIWYDWDADGSGDHLAIVIKIEPGQYPDVAEWGAAEGWSLHPVSKYQMRGWTWSANSGKWLQKKYPDVRATLLHIIY